MSHIFEHDHVLSERFGQCEEDSLGVEPRVGPQLLRVGLEGFHHSSNPKLEVSLIRGNRSDQ